MCEILLSNISGKIYIFIPIICLFGVLSWLVLCYHVANLKITDVVQSLGLMLVIGYLPLQYILHSECRWS